MMALGIIGDGRVARSLSPRMHHAVLAKHGLDGFYARFAVEPEHMAPALAGLGALGLAGVNVTVPHKRAVLPFMSRLSEEAAALEAVNTIKVQDHLLLGYNTDLQGFANSLADEGFDAGGASALVLGAGGAARAVTLALVRGGARVTVAARRPEQAEALCSQLGGQGLSLARVAALWPLAQLLVNATSVSSPEESPGMLQWVQSLPRAESLELVVDINYGRRDNMWAGLAHLHGAGFADGLGMLAHQARLSFHIWTGLDAPVEDFKAALERAS